MRVADLLSILAAALVITISLTGCTTNAERCTGMGFEPGTLDHSYCQLELRKALLEGMSRMPPLQQRYPSTITVYPGVVYGH